MSETCKHNTLVVYRRRWRDWLRRTYWVVCIRCPDMLGPFPDQFSAQAQSDAQNGLPYKF